MWYLRRDPLRRSVCRRRRGGPDDRRHGVPRPGFRRRGRPRADRSWASTAVDHRPVRVRRPADGGQRPRAHAGVQRLHLQPRGSAQGVGSRWLPVLFDCRQRSGDQGVPSVGRAMRGAFQGNVRLRDRRPSDGSGDARPRPARDKAAVPRRVDRAVAIRLDRPRTVAGPATSIPNWIEWRCITT